MARGTIKWINAEQGIGFVATEHGDVLFHVSSIVGLSSGSAVELSVTHGPRGPLAESMTLLGRMSEADASPPTPPAAAPAGRDSAGFRTFAWGSTATEVRAAHTEEPIIDDDDMVVYEGQVAGMPADIAYAFVDDRLARGKYVIRRRNDDQYLVDFMRLEELLTTKYGTPEVDDIWLDPDAKNYSTDLAMAVAHGDFQLYRTWRLVDADVRLAMTAVDFDVHVGVEYAHRELSSLEHERTKRRYLEDL